MYKCSISLENFRNFGSLSLEFESKNVLIKGANGSGKTSLLEAIFFSVYGVSFREKNLQNLIITGENYLRVLFTCGDHTIETVFDVQGNKVLKFDGSIAKRYAVVSKYLAVYLMGRENLFDGPQYERKKVIDKLAALIYPDYRALLNDYQRVMRLKKDAIYTGRKDTIVAINQKMWELYTQIAEMRGRTIEEIEKIAMAQGMADTEFGYKRSLDRYDTLHSMIDSELREEKVLAGLSYDEVVLKISGKDTRSFYSHGVKSYMWYRIFFEYAQMIAKKTGKMVFMLFDEAFSVLDEEKSMRLIDSINNVENDRVMYFFTTQRDINANLAAINLDYGRVKTNI